jgi:glycosyltransferase involved in cell wall biosynthesis
MRRVLMIAFQFPPFAGSSAVQRTLRFVHYLPEFGWEPLVLSAHPRAYEFASPDLLPDVPAGVVVERAFCLDTARHLGFARRYPGWLARPDRWISWLPAAVLAGVRMIRRYRPCALWSTFPIPTAHMIGHWLGGRSGLPWLADFRDPMVQPGDPADPLLWRAYERVERKTIARSQLNVFTTDAMRELYRERYPDTPPERFAVVENGYDEEVFASLPPASQAKRRDGPLVLLHSGAIYPLERDPTQLFVALGDLRSRGIVSRETLELRLRATGHDAEIAKLIEGTGVGELVKLAPALPYREAIAEMVAADGLLILQAGQVQTQVPAKAYEYLRAGRPILGLTDPAGDTARVLANAGVAPIAPTASREAIARVLAEFLAGVRAGQVPAPDPSVVRLASRRGRTGQLASLLDREAGAARP